MRSELNEVCLIDRYLLHQLTEAEAGAFEAGLLADSALAEKVEAQRMAHRLIRLYSRRAKRRWLEAVYRHLLDETAFSYQIKHLFF